MFNQICWINDVLWCFMCREHHSNVWWCLYDNVYHEDGPLDYTKSNEFKTNSEAWNEKIHLRPFSTLPNTPGLLCGSWNRCWSFSCCCCCFDDTTLKIANLSFSWSLFIAAIVRGDWMLDGFASDHSGLYTTTTRGRALETNYLCMDREILYAN